MELKNSYYWFKEAISPENCQKIIDLGLKTIADEEAAGRSCTAVTMGRQEKDSKPNSMPQGELSKYEISESGVENVDTYVRDSKVAWLKEQWIYDLVMPWVADANKRAGWNWQLETAEHFQFTVYNPSGFYSWHKDGGSDNPARYKRYIYGVSDYEPVDGNIMPMGYTTDHHMVGKVRKISTTINLNVPGDYDGGNLKFDFGMHTDKSARFHECEEIRPQGSLIVFPSFLPHCVTPVTRGTRYSLVLWSLGDPFK